MKIEPWLALAEEHDLSVRLLADHGCDKPSIMQWCVDHSFEHVELNAPADCDDIDEDGLNTRFYILKIKLKDYHLLCPFFCTSSMHSSPRLTTVIR